MSIKYRDNSCAGQFDLNPGRMLWVLLLGWGLCTPGALASTVKEAETLLSDIDHFLTVQENTVNRVRRDADRGVT